LRQGAGTGWEGQFGILGGVSLVRGGVLTLQAGRRQQTQGRMSLVLFLFGAYILAAFTFIGCIRSRGSSRQPAKLLLIR
jgi:hypothetical protein